MPVTIWLTCSTCCRLCCLPPRSESRHCAISESARTRTSRNRPRNVARTDLWPSSGAQIMTGRQLENLLHDLNDTREIVVSRAPEGDVALAVWRAAEAQASDAYGDWRY